MGSMGGTRARIFWSDAPSNPFDDMNPEGCDHQIFIDDIYALELVLEAHANNVEDLTLKDEKA